MWRGALLFLIDLPRPLQIHPASWQEIQGKMRLTVHTNDLRSLREALKSRCQGVRLGSEFCEYLLPNLGELREAMGLAREVGKEFTYVTPRLSVAGIEELKQQLALLNDMGEAWIVFNDFGVLNMLEHYPNLHPHLGRLLLLVPARTPWVTQHMQREDLTVRRREWLRSLFSSTSLNYGATIELYRGFGCERADLDWIPRTFRSLSFLAQKGLHLSVHLQLVPATLTRKCHLARFLGEEDPEECSRPCLDRALLIRNEGFGLELYLHGNAAHQLVEPQPEAVEQLRGVGVADLVLTMNPITKVDSAEEIDSVISRLGLD
jgi:hypothetical protein